MENVRQVTKTISLKALGITSTSVYYQLSPAHLHEQTIALQQGVEASSGALAINTGEFTGRSPKDRFIVKDSITKDKIWWGDINIPFSPTAFDKLYTKVITYLNDKELYVRDSYVWAAVFL